MRHIFALILAAAFTIAIGDHVGYETYWHASGAPITIAWDAVEGATYYKWQDYSPVKKHTMVIGEVQTNQVSAAVFSGHNVYKVFACNEIGCSDEALSTDAAVATVDGQPQGWWVFGVIGPPGPITQ